MALIVEDGSGVTGANTYASVDDARAYAVARGLALSTTDSDVEILLTNAADLIESLRSRFKGQKTDNAQAMQWPRKCVYIDDACDPFPDNAIPAELVKAQCQFAFDASLTDLQPTGDGRQTISEKVDVLEVHYSDQGGSVVQPVFTKAYAILQPLLKFASALTSVRI